MKMSRGWRTGEDKPLLPWGQTLIVIPTYNEVDNILMVLEALTELSPHLSILVVDDCSPDGTGRAVEKMREQMEKLFILHRGEKGGMASAYVEGFRWALEGGYHYIVQMDGDFSHRPEEVESLVFWAQTYDVVLGSRYLPGGRVSGWPLWRRVLSLLACFYIRVVTGIPLRDATGGFKCFSRRALEALPLEDTLSRGYIFQLELSYKLFVRGFVFKEVPIDFRGRERGSSKMSGAIVWEALTLALKLRFSRIH